MDNTQLLTLILSIIGCTTGVGTLVWSVAIYHLAGARVKVDLSAGLLSNGGYVHADLTKSEGRPAASGFSGEPVVAVSVRNVGRLPVWVANVGVATSVFTYHDRAPVMSPTLPMSLSVSNAATWYFSYASIEALISTSLSAGGTSQELFGEVILSSGTHCKSSRATVSRMREVIKSFAGAVA